LFIVPRLPLESDGLISVGIGYYVEKEVSSAASLIVFLALFFSNFVMSWLAVILAMDGSLKNAQGAQEQLDIEKSGRAGSRSGKHNGKSSPDPGASDFGFRCGRDRPSNRASSFAARLR
jgi:hypothetical protein